MRDRLYWYDQMDEITLRLARFLSTIGNVDASIYISWCYLNGRMLPKKFDLALRWALDAAKENTPEAIYYLGWVCLHGSEERFARKALEYLAEAANLSYDPAIHDEALLKEKGLDAPQQLWLNRNCLPANLMWYTEFAVIGDFSNHQETLDSDVN
jgi:TPR repeat protein